MAIALNSYVTDPVLFKPAYASKSYSLSASGVGIVSLGSNVKGIAFNRVDTLHTNTKVLSATGRDDNADGFRVNVNAAYHGAQFAVVYKNDATSLFTANTGGNASNPAIQIAQTVGVAGGNASTPDSRRLALLGFK